MKNTLVKKSLAMMTKNSQIILTGLSVTGLVSTVVLAVKGTPLALEKILDAEDERGRSLTALETVEETWLCYLPAMTMGTLTVFFIILNHKLNLRKNAALTSAYILAEKGLREYQNKVIETMGEEKHREVRQAVSKDRIEKHPVREEIIINTAQGITLCMDSLSGRYFYSDREAIKSAFNELNHMMLNEDFVTLNELYYRLELPSNDLGELLGWHVSDGLLVPSFSTQMATDGRPCLVMDFSVEPRYARVD